MIPRNRNISYTKTRAKIKETITHSVSGRKMNFTTVNGTLMTCGISFLPINPENISSDLRAVFIARIAVNVLTCPLIIMLNILVMVAVKTKQQLPTKSNIPLACLVTASWPGDGIIVQPFHIINSSFLLSGQGNRFNKVSVTLTVKCLMPPFTLLFLMSAERYVAVRHPFSYEKQVIVGRIIIASGLAWVTFYTRASFFSIFPQ